jgi:hypothetical protein
MTYKQEFCEQAKAFIRQTIVERPMSKLELTLLADQQNLPYAARAIHEACWSMYEDEEAFFNDQWLLELTPVNDSEQIRIEPEGATSAPERIYWQLSANGLLPDGADEDFWISVIRSALNE